MAPSLMVMRSTVPAVAPDVNLMTTNQWGLESGATTGYAAVAAPDFFPGIYTSLSAATDQFYSGSHSLKTSPLAGSVEQSWQTPTGTSGFPVTPGGNYNVSARARCDGASMTLAASIRWYNSSGALLSTMNGSQSLISNGSWGDVTWRDPATTHNPVAPAGAAFASVLWLSSTINATHFWLDEIGFYSTAATVSAPIFVAP